MESVLGFGARVVEIEAIVGLSFLAFAKFVCEQISSKS